MNQNVSFAHRCTQVENPGEGVLEVLPKIPRGGSRLSGKIARGGLLHFYYNCFEICLWGPMFTSSPSPRPPPLPPCASMVSLLFLQLRGNCFKFGNLLSLLVALVSFGCSTKLFQLESQIRNRKFKIQDWRTKKNFITKFYLQYIGTGNNKRCTQILQ